MKKWVKITVILFVILGSIAYFTKPSYQKCSITISEELNAKGHHAGIFLVKDKETNQYRQMVVNVTIKDRLFYRDIYYMVNGENQKIAVAAFGKVFLVN
ncbi:MAG TPA: hypothetical protein VFS36_04010 [Chitinophagaceae bacterium]|jgi:hypothetical protein|nr:hypothetical protein [Chitinophagaceae bacterium]